jgi:hypothetical protein
MDKTLKNSLQMATPETPKLSTTLENAIIIEIPELPSTNNTPQTNQVSKHE